MMLTTSQDTALKLLIEIGVPCGLVTILSKSSGAFGSKALLKNSLSQLVTLGKVKLQGNGYYRLEKAQSVKAVKVKPVKVKAKSPTKKKSPTTIVVAETPSEPSKSVLTSIDELASKLNKPVIEITDCDLKGQALAKLADLMSDDIAELLLDIKSDLERAAA